MSFYTKTLAELKQPPAVVLQVSLILGVHGMHFAGCHAWGEEGGMEERRETRQGLREQRGFDGKPVFLI